MKEKSILTCYDCKLYPCMRCDDNRPNDCIIYSYFWYIDIYKNDKKYIIAFMKHNLIIDPLHKKYFIYTINTFFPNLKSTLDTFLLLS